MGQNVGHTLETKTDINPFNLRQKNSQFADKDPDVNENIEETKSKLKFDPEDLFYDMSGEKHLLIFNHSKYDTKSRYYYADPPSVRSGTEKDVAALEETFIKLGFKTDVKNDKEYTAIMGVLSELKKTDFSSYSCLCIAILTHGSYKGELCAYDRTYNLADVTSLIANIPSLVGKPKLFFVQACRGDKLDAGKKIAIDGDEIRTFVLPTYADILIMRSNVENYKSFRQPDTGSWFIQELCEMIQKHHEEKDILHIIIMVQRMVAYNYATFTLSETTNNKRQIPETTFTLTKYLKF